jgi:hypothetical protein
VHIITHGITAHHGTDGSPNLVVAYMATVLRYWPTCVPAAVRHSLDTGANNRTATDAVAAAVLLANASNLERGRVLRTADRYIWVLVPAVRQLPWLLQPEPLWS